MRVEPFGVDSFIHVVKRGARGLPITRGIADKQRFVQLLYYLNDEHRSDFWEQDVRQLDLFGRPKSWPERQPLVKILGWTLMTNHFHLLLKEIQDGGVSRFMQSLCGSMSRHFNEKYEERGSLFQGPYRSRTIETDRYLQWAASYILVKNVFELYPAGYAKAVRDFDTAWNWAAQHKFSSLKDLLSHMSKPTSLTCGLSPCHNATLDFDVLDGFFKSPQDFKEKSRDMILGRRGVNIGEVTFE